MTAATEIRAEQRARHRSGDHDWQPGPLVPSSGDHYTMALVCGCGVVRRVNIPRPSPSEDQALRRGIRAIGLAASGWTISLSDIERWCRELLADPVAFAARLATPAPEGEPKP